MSKDKLTQEKLITKLDEWFESVADYGEEEDEQAYKQIKKMIENYDEVQAFAMEIIEGKPTITNTEIRELSTRLRDTSRQSLYETKLRRWLESKGMEVAEKRPSMT